MGQWWFSRDFLVLHIHDHVPEFISVWICFKLEKRASTYVVRTTLLKEISWIQFSTCVFCARCSNFWAMSRQRREAEMTWILVRMGVECPTFALQDHVSTVVIGRKDDCLLRCPGKKDPALFNFLPGFSATIYTKKLPKTICLWSNLKKKTCLKRQLPERNMWWTHFCKGFLSMACFFWTFIQKQN